MELFKWQVTAGNPLKWFGSTRYLRLVECTGEVTIEVEYEAPETDRQSSHMIRGIGVDLSHPDSGARVRSINFLSDVDQTLQVLVSEFPSSDSRLAGTVTMALGEGVVAYPHQALAPAATFSVAAADYRRAIVVGVLSSASGSLHVGGVGSAGPAIGMEIQPGQCVRWEIAGALDIYNPNATAQTFYVVEEY